MVSVGTADPASWFRSTYFAETSTLGRGLGSDLVRLGTSHRPVSIEAIRSIQALHLTGPHYGFSGVTSHQRGPRVRFIVSCLPWNEKGCRVRVNYAIVFVSDMKRSVSFYRDVLGLPLKFESPGWTEFATDGATLALHAGEGSNSETDNPQKVPAGRCRPGLSVPKLYEFHKRMVEHNVPCLQEPKEIFGARIALYLDPDGLGISVSEERRGS